MRPSERAAGKGNVGIVRVKGDAQRIGLSVWSMFSIVCATCVCHCKRIMSLQDCSEGTVTKANDGGRSKLQKRAKSVYIM